MKVVNNKDTEQKLSNIIDEYLAGLSEDELDDEYDTLDLQSYLTDSTTTIKPKGTVIIFGYMANDGAEELTNVDIIDAADPKCDVEIEAN